MWYKFGQFIKPQVGYGDITPVTLGEICYATFVIIQGGFMLGYTSYWSESTLSS